MWLCCPQDRCSHSNLRVDIGGIGDVTSNNHPTPAHHQHRQRLTRPIRLLTALLGLALVTSTAACSNEPAEYFTPPPATDTPVTPGELVEDEPEVFERPDLRMIAQPIQPSAANELSEDGARAFAYYFLDVLNYTAATGNTELLESISGPECNYCQSFIGAVQEVNAEYGWFVDHNIQFLDDPRVLESNELVFAFDVHAQMDAYEVYNSQELLSGYPERDLIGVLVIYRLDSHWLVEAFGKKDDL